MELHPQAEIDFDYVCILEERVMPKFKPTGKRQWVGYNVFFEGEMICESVRDPEHAACRWLLQHGHKGIVTFAREVGGTRGMTKDIEVGATMTVREDDQGLKLVAYKAFPQRGRLQD